MYNVSDSYKTFIKKPSRSFECRITLGNRVFNNSDIIQIVPTVVQPVDRFSIGNTVSQSIDITLKNDGGVYASVGEIKVEIGLKINNSIEYIPFGTFNIDDVSKTDYTVKLTCYDNMVKFETGYFSKLGNTPTLQEVVNELASITGVEFTGTIPNYTVTKLEGYTCREVLAYVASVCGGNAYITRDNKFTIIYPHEVDCTITADNYFSTGYKLEDQAYKIGMITCQNKSNSNSDSSESDDYDSVNDKNTISVGALSSDSMELTFENPWVTQSILNDIYNKLKNFSYLGYTLKWQGDLSLDPLDIITVIDKNNVTRKALVYANKLTYNGGLSAETSAKGETKNSNSFSASGSSTKNIERLSVKLLIAEKAIINKASIADLQANSARIDKLDTNVATINTALIDYANISNATIADLVATKATVSDLTASVANIDSALINKANVGDLTATNATVANLNSDLANVKTLINGNLTSANIQSLVLTSSKVTVDNGFIKNAMIESLDATKINTGSLNTSKISVTSSDGSLLIAGATQQFKDKNGKVRIQMGQDAQGNFNFILVAGDGTTTLIDGTGVKEKAIADKLIKTNMVADSAIGEQQINYSSFITGFNASTNTNFIKASKVAIDLTGQTLDIAFNNMNTTVTSVQTTANTAKSTADTASSNASSAVSTANSANTSASTALNNANNALDTANTAKTTATTASTNASNAVNTANSANSTANTANTNASTAVNTANTALNTANNIQVGGRNLYKGTKDFNTTYWNKIGSSQILEWDYDSNYKMATICGTYDSGGTIGSSTSTQGFNFSDSTKTWTISAMFKGTLDNQSIGITVSGGRISWKAQSVSNGTWKKLSWTFTGDGNSLSTFRFEHSSATVTSPIYVAQIKVEEGNKVTTWSPAPEDVDQAITSVKTVTETNTTSISAIQGQISTLISNTTITATDGTTTQLKDAYNGTVNTINSMKTSIGELTTDIDANTKDITSVTSRTSTLETNLSSISATLSSTKSTVDTHTTQISTANTNITTALNNASSAVSTANTANTTANSAKTTATTASTNASNAVTTANSASSNASTALTNSNTAISTANTASSNANNAVSTANKASTDVATLTTTVTNTVSRVSSLELTTTGLTTRVGNTETTLSNLQIGGRNFIKNSNFYIGSSYWGLTSVATVDTSFKYNSHNTLKLSRLGATTDNWYGVQQTLSCDCSQGKIYTASCYYYIDDISKLDYGFAFEMKGKTSSGDVGIASYPTFIAATAVSKKWTKISYTFTINRNDLTSIFAYPWIKRNGIVWFADFKLEEGNQATSWSPAPEDADSSISAVKDYATQTINSNVSTINQTTDAIKASVQSLQSSVSNINTTLGNKADSSTVTSVTNRVSTLETGVNGINASITTLNSNVSSVTTTANAAKSAIDNLSIGGRNLVRESTFQYTTLPSDANFILTSVNNVSSQNFTNEGYHYTATSTNGAPNSSRGIRINSNDFGLKIGDTIVFSSDIKGTFGTSNNGLCVMHATTTNSAFYAVVSGSTPHPTTITDWTRKSRTYTIPSSIKIESDGSFYLYLFWGGGTGSAVDVYIRNVKVELGNKATEWTPAPEDIDSQITTVNSSVSSLQSSVSLLQNQIALKVEQSNIDSAVSTLNGKINSTNATISSMQSSINLQLNSIASKVNQTVSTKNLANLKNKSGAYWTTTTSVNSKSGIAIKFPVTTSTPGVEINSLNLKQNTNYTISFTAWTESGVQVINNDLFPDTLPEKEFTITTTPTRYSWTLSSSSTDILNCAMRFFRAGGISNITWITDIQLEEGSIATDWVQSFGDNIGTIITQSPTQVMTAFNNISSYFKVNKDGATFGDTSTGDYTTIGANGLKHHIGGTDIDFLYLVYVMDASINIISETYTVGDGSNYNYTSPYDDIESHMHSYFVPYDSTFKKLLGGRIPKHIMVRNSVQLSTPARPADWNKTTRPYSYGSFSYNGLATGYGQPINLICDENGITVKYIQGIYMQVDRYDNYDYKMSSTCTMITGGSVGIRFLIFA